MKYRDYKHLDINEFSDGRIRKISSDNMHCDDLDQFTNILKVI